MGHWASASLGPPRYTNRVGLEQFPTGSLPVVSQIVLAQLTLMGQPLLENHSDSEPDAAAFEGALHVQQRCNGTANSRVNDKTEACAGRGWEGEAGTPSRTGGGDPPAPGLRVLVSTEPPHRRWGKPQITSCGHANLPKGASTGKEVPLGSLGIISLLLSLPESTALAPSHQAVGEKPQASSS